MNTFGDYARLGNALVAVFSAEIVGKLNISHAKRNAIYLMLQRNDVLMSYANIGYNMKKGPEKYRSNNTPEKAAGDLLEVRIAWLYQNYGLDAARRFYNKIITNHLLQHLDEHLSPYSLIYGI